MTNGMCCGKLWQTDMQELYEHIMKSKLDEEDGRGYHVCQFLPPLVTCVIILLGNILWQCEINMTGFQLVLFPLFMLVGDGNSGRVQDDLWSRILGFDDDFFIDENHIYHLGMLGSDAFVCAGVQIWKFVLEGLHNFILVSSFRLLILMASSDSYGFDGEI